jgi:D-3-phosphoglycerate dehydrogenase
MKQGMWEKTRLMGSELRGKTLGIIGTGRIGREVGYRAKAFLMNLLAFDILRSAEFAERTGARYVDLDELLRESDFVSIHVPLSPRTRHMIGRRELELMKPTAVLINTSRGEVVDEVALAEALMKGKIAGACLDVYEREPPKDSPLLKLPNVVLTPHIGASTVEAQREAAMLIAEKIKVALSK